MVHSLLQKPRELLITIYIGNELVNIGISVVITSIAISVFGSAGVGVAIGISTFLLLFLGEIVPKTISLKYAQPYALFAAYPLKGFANIVQPAQKLFNSWTEKIMRSFGILTNLQKESSISDEEFRTMVQVGEGEGVIDSDERDLIHNAIEFAETTVGEVMTPKIDMFTVNIKDSLDEILPRIVKNFYSRVPVYGEEEEILGILFTKDLTRLKHLPREKVNLKSILHPSVVVPKSKMIKEMLEEFRKLKRHMAIVLDEYGSVCGLVTLEDIIEEIFGEIEDERDIENNKTNLVNKALYFDGGTRIADFNDAFLFGVLRFGGISNISQEISKSYISEDLGVETMGGFVFKQLGRLPKEGEFILKGNIKLTVEEVKENRITIISAERFVHD